MMVGILGSRVLGLLRESVIAHKFGQDRLTDVYNAAFTIPDLLFFLIAGGALSGAFIPVFTEYVSTDREKEAWRIFSVVAAVMTLVVSAFIVLGEIFTVPLVVLTNPGYVTIAPHLHGFAAFSAQLGAAFGAFMDPSHLPFKVQKTVELTRIVLPAQICFFLGGLMMGSLQGKGNFWGQALGPVIYNACIIFGGVVITRFLGPDPAHQINGLCYGAVGGAIIGNLALQWYLVRKNGGVFVTGWRAHWRHDGVTKVWKLMLPVILGLALPQVSTIIGRMYASTLGDGPQTALMNANKLMQVPLGVFAQATAIAIFPTMAAQAARKEIAGLRQSVNYGIRSILFLTLPSSMLMWVLALPFVQLVFQSGKFSTADAMLAANVLRWFAVGIFAWSAHSVITRGFYALQDSRTPVIVGTLVTLIFIPLNSPLKDLMGVSGLALATSIAATIHMVSMLYLLRRRLNGIEGGRLLTSLGKILTASIAASAVCWLVYRPFVARLESPDLHGARTHALVVLVVCLTVSTIVYGGLALLLRMEEVAVVTRMLRRRR
jgi:putative peptidoglycan lipid II flippase